MKPIVLVPLGDADRTLVSDLRDALEQKLVAPVEVREAALDLERFYSTERVQYNSSEIIQALQRFSPPLTDGKHSKVLAVVREDLFIPILTYVFGEAELDGEFAVVSYHRLQNAAYGLPPNPALEFDRLLKEALHEVGHTLGLIHCTSLDCVMHTSTYVEDIDLKQASFCPSCTAFMRKRHLSPHPSH